MQIGVLTVVDTETSTRTSGITAAGNTQSGRDHIFQVRGPDHLEVTVADTTWDNDEREVRAIGTAGPPQLGSLEGRLRLTVRGVSSGLLTCDMKQARVRLNTEPMWSNLFQADLEEHGLATGVDIGATLEWQGSVVGSRELLLGDDSSSRRGFCALFPNDSRLVPVIGFCLTRILPLLNMVFVPGTSDFLEYEVPERAKQEDARHIYVVGLSRQVGISPDPSLLPVYVGQTGKPRADRFREHKIGYRSSRWVRRFGIRLMYEFLPETSSFDSRDEIDLIESEWAGELEARGHLVKGGH